MMKVAVFHPWLKERGGAEKAVLEYAQRSENDVTVLTLFYDQESTFEEFAEVDVRQKAFVEPRGFLSKGLLFGLGSFLLKVPKEFDKFIISEAGIGSLATFRNKKHDLSCYCHTPLRAALPEFRTRYRSELPFYLQPVFDVAVRIYNFLERKAWKNFDKVIANSETTKERIQGKGLRREVKVVHPGADVEGNEQGDFGDYFFYPSRFRRYKRQELAIEAFKQSDTDDFRLVLAGSNQEPEYVEELRELADGDVEIETDVSGDRWRELYANCRAVLFLAENEDWGIIPVEAGSYGKPVIAVDEGGPKESVIDGETGFLVEARPEEIAKKIEFLAENIEEAKAIGRKGLEESKKYSWNNFQEKIDEIIGS